MVWCQNWNMKGVERIWRGVGSYTPELVSPIRPSRVKIEKVWLHEATPTDMAHVCIVTLSR